MINNVRRGKAVTKCQTDERRNVIDGIRFHDDRADIWSGGYSTGAFKRRLVFVSSNLRALVKPSARWLDAGCGSGVLSRELRDLEAMVEGVDASPRMVDAARRESAIKAGDINYRVVQSIEHLESPDASFDGVLCSSVVEYLADPGRAFSEFSRVLVPGGFVVITVPNRLSLVRTSQKILRACCAVLGRKCFAYLDVSKNEFTKSGLRQALRSVGLETEKLDVFDPILPSMFGRIVFGSLLLVTARRLPGNEKTGYVNHETCGSK